MLEAVIFDMDGVIIDSEPYWRKAEIEVFARVGLHLTEEDCIQTLGYRIDEVGEYWFARQPWDHPITPLEVSEAIVDKMVGFALKEGKALAGFAQTLEQVKQSGLPTAVASSSPLRLIKATLKGLKIENAFDVVCSAESEDYGKPHPAVFITAAKQLNVDSSSCLVIEDSPSGVIAARAAKMKVVAVPEPQNAQKPEISSAHLVLESLADFNLDQIRTDLF